jgi:F0F1-type ATP synthase assembly protein I
MNFEQQKKGNFSGLINSFQKATPYINIVYTLIGSVLMFGFIGWWLDSVLSLKPWLFLAGLFSGFIIGFYHFLKTVKKLEKDGK